jgi:hypothetical protein
MAGILRKVRCTSSREVGRGLKKVKRLLIEKAAGWPRNPGSSDARIETISRSEERLF